MLHLSKGSRSPAWIAALLLLAAGCGGAAAQEAGSALRQPRHRRCSHRRANRNRDVDGGYVFRAEVQEVTLRATVVDEHRRPVTTLDRNAFQVFEDGKPQPITFFRREDIPVALAVVIDNSGSMRDKRPSVNAAALNLVRESNPQDQVCVINFNNEYYLDQDYTGNVALLQDALDHIESRGGTALYDALVATSDHLMKSAKLQKKIILVVTDGEDTASQESLEEAVRAIAVDGGPAVYAIGILGHEKEKKARRALRILAEQTGGVAFFPGRPEPGAGHLPADCARHPRPVHDRLQTFHAEGRGRLPAGDGEGFGQRL